MRIRRQRDRWWLREQDFEPGPPRPSRKRRPRRLLALALVASGLAGMFVAALFALESEESNGRGTALAQDAGARVTLRLPNIAHDGTPEPTPTPTPTPTPPPKPKGINPAGMRAWSDGDSTSYFMTVALFQLLNERGGLPVRGADYKISSGLANPGFFNWPAYLASEMATYDPEIVVFMVGANDAGYIGSYESYSEKVGAAMDQLEGRRVYWVGQPTFDPALRPDLYRNVQVVNEVFQAQASLRPWVTYVDTWGATSDGNGNFTYYAADENGETQLMRAADGVHFTPAGGRLLARAVLRAMTAE